MRIIEKFGANRTQAEINLPFSADTISIKNPTGNVIYIRTGGTDYPASAQSSDITVLPYSHETLSCDTQSFAVKIGNLALAAPVFNSLFPTAIDIVFTSGELSPSFGSMALGQIASAAILFFSRADIPVGSVFYDVVVPPSIHTLTVAFTTAPAITILRIVGQTTQIEYFNGSYATGKTALQQTFKVDPENDPLLRLTFNNNAANSTCIILGYQERLVPINTTRDGRQIVDATDPGSGYVPVGPPPGATGLPVSNSPTPTYVSTGRTIAPAVNSILAALTIAATGRYYVEVAVASDDTAAVGKFIKAAWTNAAESVANRELFVPVPGSGSTVWAGVVAATPNDIVRIRNGTAGAGGSSYSWSVSAYLIA